MYTEYGELYDKYTKLYGAKTAIFLMVGSFYELYDIQNTETGDTKYNVRNIVDFLGIQLSIKKKDIDDSHDGLFAGFPDYVMHKWAGRLTAAGWTVVIVDQVKDSKGKVIERKVSRILSPSTHVENMPSSETPYVASIYFHCVPNAPPSFGVAILDLTTGTTNTYSGVTNGRADIWTADDLVQMLSVFQPKEVIIYWHSLQTNQAPDTAYFRRIFGISTQILVHLREVETLGATVKELVRNEYFQKIYQMKTLLPAKTYLGLRTEEEELSLVFLLQFIEDHMSSALKSFHRNEPWTPNEKLICGNHALTQLQMTNPSSQIQNDCIIGLFDKCITPMGKRAIKERLLTPLSDATAIRKRLEEVLQIQEWPEDRVKALDRQFRFMFDLPRLHRKLLCGQIAMAEIAPLYQTYSAIQVIITNVIKETPFSPPFSIAEWQLYISTFNANFDESKALKISEDLTPFNSSSYPEIAAIEQQLNAAINAIDALRREYCESAGLKDDTLRLEAREKEPYGIKGTKVALQQLNRCLKNLPDGTHITALKSSGWVDCKRLQELNLQIERLRETLQRLVRNYMADACQNISESSTTIWSLMESWVAHLDCTNCIAKVSKERGYSCPVIQKIDDNGSGLDIKNVRHPLVESISNRVSYVKHDVSLGEPDKAVNGWLVYGMNASGKSTLMKAVGLCVLLAQAGCFVPAKEMTLRPFKAIYTRILNQDNLFAGLSSFAVEMSELRDILRNADKYTLVLGDELCAGTESISAQALVASGIQWLSKRGSKFIFATHLHDLPNILDIKKLLVEVWHLHVDYNPITKKLIYDRTLRPGSGSTLYGLEVARAMDLPMEFIEQALNNRHQIMGTTRIAEAPQSQWNRDIIRKECEICGCPVVSQLEVHHIQQRSTADLKGVLRDGAHMNDVRNLVVLCEKCHDKHHAGNLTIGDIIQTSHGQMRSIIDTSSDDDSKKSIKKSKWSDEDMTIIKKVLKEYRTLSLKSLRAHLESKYEVSISEGQLGKIRKELD